MAASLLATSVFATRQHINILHFLLLRFSLFQNSGFPLPPTRKCVGVCGEVGFKSPNFASYVATIAGRGNLQSGHLRGCQKEKQRRNIFPWW